MNKLSFKTRYFKNNFLLMFCKQILNCFRVVFMHKFLLSNDLYKVFPEKIPPEDVVVFLLKGRSDDSKTDNNHTLT